jgi:hypothetical protein
MSRLPTFRANESEAAWSVDRLPAAATQQARYFVLSALLTSREVMSTIWIMRS